MRCHCRRHCLHVRFYRRPRRRSFLCPRPCLVAALTVTDALLGIFEIQLPFHTLLVYLLEFSFFFGISVIISGSIDLVRLVFVE